MMSVREIGRERGELTHGSAIGTATVGLFVVGARRMPRQADEHWSDASVVISWL